MEIVQAVTKTTSEPANTAIHKIHVAYLNHCIPKASLQKSVPPQKFSLENVCNKVLYKFGYEYLEKPMKKHGMCFTSPYPTTMFHKYE